MIREVDLVSYLPTFMQPYKEPVAALDAEIPEFEIIWKATDQVLKNHFISTADEYGVSRFEKLLGIYPTDNDTLESRRSRVQSKWFSRLPYTLRVLLQKLTVLCGSTDFKLNHDFTVGYTLTLETDLELYGQVEELEYIINTMVPENIAVDSRNSIPCNIKSDVLFGGGVVQADALTVTNDSRENMVVRGSAVHGAAVSHTVNVVITQDFDEQFEISGKGLAASGIVMAGHIEIN